MLRLEVLFHYLWDPAIQVQKLAWIAYVTEAREYYLGCSHTVSLTLNQVNFCWC